MKRFLSAFLLVAVVSAMLFSCGAGFKKTDAPTIITREDGSGTRGAFTELFGIENMLSTAITNNSTGVVMTTVASDVNAIGYISLGSLNDTVKALKIDGADATVANIKNGTYKVSRPFNIAYKELSALGQDFLNFILSSNGQAVVEEKGYIKVDDKGAFTSTNPTGTLKISGSSSVTPVMEKLKEAYLAINPAASIEINMTDSSSGMKAAADGTSEIGMASRAVKQSELDKGLTPVTIATDGIAVIVNPQNPLEGLTKEDVKRLYTEANLTWESLSGATWKEEK